MTKSECSTSQQQNRSISHNNKNNNNNNAFGRRSNINHVNNNSSSNSSSNGSVSSGGSGTNYHENGSATVGANRKSYHNSNYYYNNNHNHQRTALSDSGITQLNNTQVERLRSVLQQNVEIHGRENFPTLKIPLQKFIVHVRRKIAEFDLHVKHVKLNGGAASYVLAAADNFAYSDLDLIFPISLKTEHDFDKVRTAVFDTLLELMPESTNKEMISSETLKDIYIRKMVRVINNDHDRWSLFSLHNHYGRCIELKFVDKMRRQFEFSVDSFQITLDRLLENLTESRPSIQAESMYGHFSQALHHLNRRLIDTRNPEEIRGGGLLKYCHLLTRGYRATYNCREMEKYMCSRFFIDFSDINAQEAKLCAYLDNHFGSELEMKYDYLQVLYRVIKESTVCLMGHERRQTLSMVEHLRNNLRQISCYTDQQQQRCYPSNGTVYYSGHDGSMDERHNCILNNNINNNITNYVNPVYYVSPVTPTVVVGVDSAQGSPCPSPATSPSVNQGLAQCTSESTASIDSAIETSADDYLPRQTILYLPPNSTRFEFIGSCEC